MPTFEFEQRAYLQYSLIGGGDEVGRGCLAGPVVASIVILDPKKIDKRIDDSKKLNAKLKQELSQYIKSNCIDCEVGIVDANIIDEINIYQATKLAFGRAFEKLKKKPNYLLLDAMTVESIPVNQKSLIKGDQLSYSIAAASILAKVYRDELMLKYDDQFPGYGFKSNKGYGTKVHLEAIKNLGPCEIHRKSFKPISKL